MAKSKVVKAKSASRYRDPSWASQEFRRRFIYFLITFITFFSLLDMVTGRQDFPFAPFDMFAGMYKPTQKPNYEKLVIVFIDKDGHEVPSQLRYIYPFDDLRLASSLNSTLDDSAMTKTKLTEILDIAKKNHENDPVVPEFVAVRLYKQNLGSDKISQNLAETGNMSLISEYKQDP